jgi:hypothetical protein
MKHKRSLIAFAALLCASQAHGQLSANDAVTAQQMVDALVGTGSNAPTVSNIVYTGDPIARGLFTGGTGPIGFEDGIVLSSGDIDNVETAGNNVSNQTSTINAGGGDADLASILPPGSVTNNAAVLEFDFECEFLQQISFQYVFASEEYNEYANSTFNDVFAFFVNGVNVALLPDNVTVVSINNVNGGNPIPVNAQNPAFYVNNSCNAGIIGNTGFPCVPPRATEMDGMTVILNVSTAVNPGLNHIKIAIADVGDSSLDSVVFIKSASFTCAPPLGACCLPDGNCLDLSESDCLAAGGVFDPAALCAAVQCPGFACCLADGSCIETTQQDCTMQGGVFHAGLSCAAVTCPQPTAACCLLNGSCVEVTEAECTALAGTFHAGVGCAGVTCPQPSQCVYSQGYWKNHPEDWPVNSLTLGNVVYTQAQLLSILRRPVRGNGLVSLAHQLIAAKLNAANGALVPASVQTAINSADALIGNSVIPPVGTATAPTSSTSGLAGTLDAYNNGNTPGGPPHCD